MIACHTDEEFVFVLQGVVNGPEMLAPYAVLGYLVTLVLGYGAGATFAAAGCRSHCCRTRGEPTEPAGDTTEPATEPHPM